MDAPDDARLRTSVSETALSVQNNNESPPYVFCDRRDHRGISRGFGAYIQRSTPERDLRFAGTALGVLTSARRTIADVLVFTGGLLVLMIVITASDDRVRRDVWRLSSNEGGPGTLTDLSDHLSRIGGAAADVVSQWSYLHPYLVAFALVAAVTIFAVRRL